MTRPLPGIVLAVQRKFRTTIGKRFSRFFVAAVAAVVASQVVLATCLGYLHWTAGRSALAAWVAGAGTSYIVSRWAWERKGKPDLLRETVPFWAVAIAVAIILTSTTKFANQRAIAMGLTHSQQVMFDGAAYFIANTVTFLLRFVLFHYVLFADRRTGRAAGAEISAAEIGAPVNGAGPVQPKGSASRNGSAAGSGSAAVNGSAAGSRADAAGKRSADAAQHHEEAFAPVTRRRS